MSRGRLRCRACEWETSLTAGTVFQDTRKPLRMWFLEKRVWIQPMKSCRVFTLSLRFSSGGCSALTRAASSNNTSITTSTNSLFGSTGDAQMLAGCCSTGSPSRRLRSTPRLTVRLSVTPGQRNQLNGCEGDTHYMFYSRPRFGFGGVKATKRQVLAPKSLKRPPGCQSGAGYSNVAPSCSIAGRNSGKLVAIMAVSSTVIGSRLASPMIRKLIAMR